MSAPFSYELEHTQPVALLRPRGVLDAYTAADLRAALLDCLTEQPVGLVIDVAELSVAEDVALTVFATVARESERWPGTRFALGGAAPDFVASIDRMGVAQYMLVCPDIAAARLELGRRPVPPWHRLRIEPDRFAPALAREAVQEFCTEFGVAANADTAELVASELVTNAVVHAGTPIDLTLRLLLPHLHIAVRDGGDGQPRIIGFIDESAESGRGLILVDALASAWGSLVSNHGKTVWATVGVRLAT